MEKKKMNKTETINLIRCLLLSNEEEMYLLSEFLSDFEEEAGRSLPLFGHKTALDFLNSIPDIVEVISTDESKYLKIVQSDYLENAGINITSFIKKKVKEVDKSSPSTSVAVTKAVEDGASKNNCKPKETKTKSTKARVIMIEEPVENLESEEEDECEKSTEPKVEEDKDALCGRCVSLKAELAYEACIDRCLSSIVLDERDIPLINLRHHAKVGEQIEVSVPEVKNPHTFILHLRKFKVELTKLMGRMLTFYNIYGAKYAVENYKFENDEICAALYRTSPECREWYRAKIINFGSKRSTVLLIDYGITTEVSNQNLKFLDNFFASLPVQVLNGHLANVKPFPGEHWSRDCCERFYDLVFEKDLVAQVIKMDCQERWLSVILSYADKNICINDNVVKKKLPVGGRDFSEEESLSPVDDESNNREEFIKPEDVGKTRRLRSDFGDSDKAKIKKKVPYQEKNKELRILFGLEVSDDELSSNSE